MRSISLLRTFSVGVSLFGALALAACGGPRERTPEELATAALAADTLGEREAAVAKLVEAGPPAVPHLRRILAESDDPSVIALAIDGLGRHYDFDSMAAIIDAMEHESPVVRGQAGVVVARLLGRDRRFSADLPDEDRRRIIGYTRADWEEVSNSDYFEEFKRRVRGEE